MKILILTNHSYMLYRFRLELIMELSKSHEVVLSMPFVGHEDDFQSLGIRCIPTEIDRRGINPIKDGKLLQFYRKLLKQESPDLVITYSIKPNIYGGIACAFARIPYCANVQGLGTAFERPLLATLVTVLYRYALRKARTVFFENYENSRLFEKKQIITRKKMTVLNGAGINLEKYSYAEYPDQDLFRFLYIGRIMQEKGMDELFSAVERLAMEYPNRFILDLVGFYEDSYKERVEELEEMGLVKFHGFQTDPHPYYANADCVVLPSYHEGMSNVLLEAAAMGRPIITTDIPGCREAVNDGESGYLCASRDADSLYCVMKKMLLQNRETRAQMGMCGHQKMRAEFDKTQVVNQTVNALML